MIVTDYFYATHPLPRTQFRAEATGHYFLLFDIQQTDAVRETLKKKTNFSRAAALAGVFRANFSLELLKEQAMRPPTLCGEARKVEDYIRSFREGRKRWWKQHPAYNSLKVGPAPGGNKLTDWEARVVGAKSGAAGRGSHRGLGWRDDWRRARRGRRPASGFD